MVISCKYLFKKIATVFLGQESLYSVGMILSGLTHNPEAFVLHAFFWLTEPFKKLRRLSVLSFHHMRTCTMFHIQSQGCHRPPEVQPLALQLNQVK